jgi:Fe-S cluster assembly protein SufD
MGLVSPLPAGLDEAALRALSNGEPDWLKTLRSQALARSQATAFPTTADELWRRTPPARFKLDGLLLDAGAAPTESQVAAPLAALGLPELRSGVLVTVNGRELPISTGDGIVSSFTQAARSKGEAVKAGLALAGSVDSLDRWAALSLAFAQGGAYVRVPKGKTIEHPICIVHRMEGEARAAFVRTLIHAEAGSTVTVLEVMSSGEAATGLLHASVDVVAEQGATVHYLRIQDLGSKTAYLSSERLHAHRDSQVNWSWGALGSSIAKSDMSANLLGEGIHAMISGFYRAGGVQHLDHHTFQNHEKGNTISDLLYKGALEGKARSIYMGLIKIHKEAQRSDAYQANRNLMLSPLARADSIPSLEIEANDVRCTHGATMGEVDAEQLFYLVSRGIPRDEAIRLIVDGFYEPVFDRIVSVPLRTFARNTLEKRLAR